MAARSFSITVVNQTGRDWTRGGMSLNHGVWSDDEARVPPEHLPKASLDGDGNPQPGVIFFESESQGFATGTEGSVDYNSDRGETLHIFWDNPFVGGNSFSASVPNLRLCWGDPSGNDANITLRIQSNATPC